MGGGGMFRVQDEPRTANSEITSRPTVALDLELLCAVGFLSQKSRNMAPLRAIAERLERVAAEARPERIEKLNERNKSGMRSMPKGSLDTSINRMLWFFIHPKSSKRCKPSFFIVGSSACWIRI